MRNLKINRQIILIVIAVLILASVFFYFFISKPKIELGSVPSGWGKVKDLKVERDALGIQYKGTGTIEEAISAFKAEMTKVGWTHLRDEIPEEGFSFSVLRKDGYEATVFAVRTEEGVTTVTIVAGKLREEPAKKPEVPKEDVEGEDMTDVHRYQGAVIISYESSPRSTSIEYLTSENVSTVADFYATQLPANGWTLEGMMIEEQKAEITATKTKRGLLTISIETSKDYDDYTNVEVVLTSLEI